MPTDELFALALDLSDEEERLLAVLLLEALALAGYDDECCTPWGS